MATERNSVLANTQPVNPGEFDAALRAGIERAVQSSSERDVCFAMDLSRTQLRNILSGASSTSPKPLFDALQVDASALADVAALYRKVVVDIEPAYDCDDLSLLLARVMVMVREASDLRHGDYLNGEPLMRELNAATGAWIEKCRNIRRPRGGE